MTTARRLRAGALAHQDQFAHYVARKTAAALAATLPPLVTDFDLAVDNLPAIGNAWTRRRFDGGFYLSPAVNPDWPACSLVFVQSLDGNTGTPSPANLGGGATDTHVIYEGLSQVTADAVLAGADTVRGGDVVFGVWHPQLVRMRTALGQPRYPIQIVATLHGMDLDATMIFNLPDLRVQIITIAAGAYKMHDQLKTHPWIQPIVMKRPEDLPRVFEALRRAGVARISAVGGRHLATQLIDAGLVQDLYVTTSPRPGGEADTPFYPGSLPARALVRKHGTGADVGVTFEHRVLLN